MIDLATGGDELFRFFAHTNSKSLFRFDTVPCGIFTNVLRDLHRAKMRTAHRAEVSELRPLGRQGFVVKFFRLFGVKAEIELVFPAKLEPRF